MPLPIIPNTWRVSVDQTMGGIAIANVIHITYSGAANDTDIGEAVQNAWFDAGSIKDLQCEALKYISTSVIKLTGSAATTVVPWQGTGPFEGNAAGVPCSVQTAMLVTLRTALGGRSHRGRMYIAGAPVDSLNTAGTAWDSSYVDDAQASVEHFKTELDSALSSGCWRVVSAVLEHTTTITAVTARPYLGTQRRRTS